MKKARDDIERIKAQIQMLHARLEIVEESMSSMNAFQLMKLQNEINNIKISLFDIKNGSDNNGIHR